MKQHNSAIRMILMAFMLLSCSQIEEINRLPAFRDKNKNKIFVHSNSLVGLPRDFQAGEIVVMDLNNDGYLDLRLNNNNASPIEIKAFINQKGKNFLELPIKNLNTQGGGIVKFARDLFAHKGLSAIVRYPDQKLEAFTLHLSDSEIVFNKVDDSLMPNDITTSGDIQFLDHNQDGKLDILATSFYAKGKGNHAGPLFLFEQTSKSSFVNIAKNVGIGDFQDKDMHTHEAAVPSYMANVCDINGDGHLDLLIAGYGRRWNKLLLYESGNYVNQAKKLKFDADNIGKDDYRGNGNSFTAQCADIDRDGDLDVFQGEITHKWAGETSDKSSLLINRYPAPFERMTNLPRPKNFNNQGDIGSVFGDIDLDGFKDLIIANSDYPPETKLITLLNDSDNHSSLSFEEIVFKDISHSFDEVISPKGAVLFDFDRDGDLDLIVSGSNMRGNQSKLNFFINQTQQRNKREFINLILVGDGAHVPVSPVGTRVSLLGAEKPYINELVFGGGQDAQHPLEAHFVVPKDQIEMTKIFHIQWNKKNHEKIQLTESGTYIVTFTKDGSRVEKLKP